MSNEACVMCGWSEVRRGLVGNNIDLVQVVCPCCGKYQISSTATMLLGNACPYKDRLYLLSALTRQRTESRQPPLIIGSGQVGSEEKFKELVSVIPTDLESKSSALLFHFAKKSEHPGSFVLVNPLKDYPVALCCKPDECTFLASDLAERGWIKESSNRLSQSYQGSFEACLTVAGWKRIDELKRVNPLSRQAFVAMSFNSERLHIFTEGVEPLYAETGFKMVRVDMVQFNDDVVARIFAEIRRSRFLIAELTEPRDGVYFEAGFAMGIGIPVIWTCEVGKMDKVHFDVNHFSHVTWKDTADLREKLKNRIQGTIPIAGQPG